MRVKSRDRFIGLVVICTFAFFALWMTQSLPPESLTGRLPVSAPSFSSTGETIEVSVGPVPRANGKPIGLIVVGDGGPFVYNSRFDNSGMAYFTIPAHATAHTGFLALIVAADDARGEANVILTPELPRSGNDHLLVGFQHQSGLTAF